MQKNLFITDSSRKRGTLHAFCATFLPALFVLALLTGSMNAWGQTWNGWCYRDYAGDGTFTVPANCTELYIEAIGAGGGGGRADQPSNSILNANTRTGTGGGGGAYARKHVTSPSGNYTITIGIGGGSGADGTATTVTGSGCNITAGGGKAGQSNIHGVGTTGTGGAGGTATGGDANYPGGTGGKVCDNRDLETGWVHDNVGSGGGGGAGGGNGNGGTSNQPTGHYDNAKGVYGAGGGGSANNLTNNYSNVTTWYKGGNGGAGLFHDSGWGSGSTGGYPGGGGGGARAKARSGNNNGGSGSNGFVRVWFKIYNNSTMSVTASASSTVVTPGSSVTLTATPHNNLTGTNFSTSYQWNSNANSSTNSIVTLNNLQSTKNYAVTLTNKLSYASHTCARTASGSVDVTVSATVPDFEIMAQKYSACPNAKVDIQPKEALPSGYDWAVFKDAACTQYGDPSNHHAFIKSGTSTETETAYVKVVYGGSAVGTAKSVLVEVNDFCGSTSDLTCTNGTVIYSEDFGGNNASDPNYSSTNAGFTSQMTFVPGGMPGRGGYGILKHIPENFSGFTPVANNSDHTNFPNTNVGYFMFIDPSDNSMGQTVAETTISNLCDNSELTFSFWASDMWSTSNANNFASSHSGVQPSVPKFDMQLIDPSGNILVQTSECTPTRTENQSWYQYGVKYVVPEGLTSVKFRLVNRENNGMGNDYGIDDIKVTFCGIDIVQHNPDIEVCEGESVELNTTVTISSSSIIPNPRYKWQKTSTPNVESSWQTIGITTVDDYVISAATTSDAGYYRMFVADESVINDVPTISKCAIRTEENFHVVVNPKVEPAFDLQEEYCYGASVTLPTTSANSIVGTWSPATVNTTNPGTQTYTFTPNDMTCAQTYEIQITVQQPTDATITGPDAICAGENATYSVPEVTGNTYKWSTNETTASITVSTANTYKVTVTSGGCTSIGSKTLTVNPKPTVTPTVTNAKCKGSTDGKVVLAISSISAPFQVKWNGSTTAETVSSGTTYTKENLVAGTYSAEVISNDNCSTTVNDIVVGQPAADLAVASITFTPESCTGNDATASVEVTGGTTPYTVTLTDGTNTYTTTLIDGKYKAEGLTSGAPTTTSKTYTVNVTDANACTPTSTSPGSVTITLDNPLDMNNITIPPVCSGYEFSYVPANGTDGTIPTGTTYSWPQPAAISGISGLAASTGDESRIHGTLTNSTNAPIQVTYTVTPKNGVCVGNATPSTVTINASATINPLVTVDVADKEVCPTAGTITLTAPFTNVNSVHSVVWKQGSTTVQTTNNIAANVTSDSYSFAVPTTPCNETYNFTVEYTDASHCTASDAFTVKVRIPAWSINATDFPAGADNVECQADATEPTAVPTGAQILDGCGQATTRELYSTVVTPNPIVDQGTVTYTYRYTACDGSHNDWQFVYTVDDQTDPSFNTDVITTKPADVPETPNCTFFVPDLAPDVIGSVSDNCSTTATDFTITQDPVAGTQITEPTQVTVTVTDKAGNSNFTYVTVTVPDPLSANVTGTDAITHVTCHGGNDGSFTVTANGGKTPYQYKLDDGTYQDNNTFSDLTANTYSVIVRDANNCELATPITVTINEPDALHIDGFPSDNVSEFCDPGEGYATVTWPAPTFAPSDNSATMTILVEYPDGTTANALPTDNHYPVGTTTITYTATNSCPETVVKSFTITVVDNQPPCIGCVPGNLDPDATDGNNCDKIIASGTNNITLAAGTFTYEHSGNGWDVTAADNDGIKSLTYTLTGATTGTGTSLAGVTFNVGKTTVTWTAVDNSDLTDQCSFDVTVKAQVTVTANSQHFNYDGNPHSENGYVLTSGTTVVNGTSGTPVTLPNNDALTAVITGTITNAGSVPNVVDNVTIVRGSEDMTEYYVINKVNGTLTVDKTDLVLIDSVFSKTYDGTPLELNFNELDKVVGLANGDQLTAGKVTTDGYIAGHYTYNYPVLDGGSYVAGTMADNGTASIVVPFQTANGIENYNLIIHIYGTIVTRPITITGGTATKTYDGTALTNSTYSYSNLAETDDITSVTVTGSQVCVGQSANVPSNAEIKHRSDNVTVNGSYDITYEDGTLQVTDIPADNLTCPPQYDIVLWYGRCDTVAYMPAFPTLSPNVAYPDVKFVSNVDEFNPLQPGQTYTITWSVLDACGSEMNSTHCTQVVTVSYPPCDTVEDRDGFRYGAKRIGCDCWTVDNLRSTMYSDGTPVNKYWRYKDSDSLENIYGKLYTWYSAAGVTEDDDLAVPAEVITTTGAYVQGICPEGWALPKMAEFWTMYNVSGGQAGLVKSPSSLVWLPERAGIAENKFNAFGAGYYAPTIERYENLLGETHFWASDTSRTAMMAKNFELNYYCENGLENLEDKGLGYSIRCVKKEPVFECGVTGVSDLQGNGYGTMQVGNLCWMTENVRYTTADSKSVTDQNGDVMDPRIFGYLYDWNSIFNGETPGDNVQGICPKGWHIPTTAEWNDLQSNLAGESANVCNNTIGKSMASTFGWNNSTVDCAVGNEPANNNNSNFNAMPVGNDDPVCNGFGNITTFWTASEYNADKAYVRDINFNSPDVNNYTADKTNYNPLRCVKNL